MQQKLLKPLILLVASIGSFMPLSLWAQGMAVDEENQLVYHGAASLEPSIVVVDVSDPVNPVQIGNVAIPGAAIRIVLDKADDRLFVATGSSGATVIDVSSPANPTVVGGWSYLSTDVAVKDNFAYIASGGETFSVLDISDLSNAVLKQSIDYISRSSSYSGPTIVARSARIYGNILWIGGSENDVNIYEITSPGELSLISGGSLGSSSFVTGTILFKDNYAIGVNGTLFVKDAVTGAYVNRLSQVSGLGTVLGDHVYVTQGNEVRVFDASDVPGISEVSQFRHSEDAVQYAVPRGIGGIGDTLFVQHSSSGFGFAAFDVSDVTSPELLSRTSAKYNDPTPNPFYPVGEAGPNQYVQSRQTVKLDAGASYDYDGSIVSYTWKQTYGPAVELSSTTDARVTFTAPRLKKGDSTTLSFQLFVKDNDGYGGGDFVNIYVSR